MKVKNAAARNIETKIGNRDFKPYKGGEKNNRDSKLEKDIKYLLVVIIYISFISVIFLSLTNE